MTKLELLTEDEEVIEKILAGEKAMFEILVRRYNPQLYKIGRNYNYNHEDTEDLMQESFVDAYKNLSKFEGRSSFRTWIFRIMLNNCYRRKEKSSYKNEIMKEIFDHSKPLFHQSDNDTHKIVHKNELNKILESALKELPHYYRLVFTLREINGLSVKETAELAKISESNVKIRLNRAKKMLQNIITQSYAPEELYDYHAVYCDPFTEKVMKKINEL